MNEREVKGSEGATAIVLASGRGVRIGGPKALLAWTRGQSLIEAHVVARETDCKRVVIVTRPDIALRIGSRARTARVVISEEPDDLGPAGSIGAAIAAGALAGMPFSLITPVDVPPANASVVASLLDALKLGATAARPCFGQRRGHPVAVRVDALVSAYVSNQRPPLREVLRALHERCRDVETDQADILVDLDTPEAYEARMGCPPSFL